MCTGFLRGLRPRCVALVLLAQSLSAATYYVSTNGNDGNPGTPTAAFQTLQKAVNSAFAGDTIVVFDGTYGHGSAVTGGDSDPNEYTPVTLYNSGAPGAPITITSANQWGAVLDCELTCDAYINLYNASYIVIQNFVIRGGYKEGIHSNDSAHHITLQGNRIEYIANRPSGAAVGLDGMYVNPDCHDFVINGNIFHDIGRTNSNQLDHGLYLHGTNFTVTNNVFYNIPHGWAIQAADGLSNVLIANNTFAFPEGGGQTGQIMLWNTQSNLTIENNIFYGPQNYAINRFYSTVNGCSINHNLVYGASDVMADASGCTVAGTQNADPHFVNAASAPLDFHLLADSPAIAYGISLAAVPADRNGTARGLNDIGAYQYTAPPYMAIGNTTTGSTTWSVGDEWAIGIVGGTPRAQVMVSVGAWSGVAGYADENGNFSSYGIAKTANIGSINEVWTVGGARVNPQSVSVTVVP
jgi:hypothetical protein